MKFYILLFYKRALILRTAVFSTRGIACIFLNKLLERRVLMRVQLLSVFLLTAFLQVHANIFAQKITISAENVSLDKVFTEISKQSGYDFFYNSTTIEKANLVTVHLNNAELKEVLDSCFLDQPFGYSIKNKSIVVTNKRPKKSKLADNNFINQTEINGRVTNQQGHPLPGVNVKVKGSETATVSDNDGQFKIFVTDNQGTLVFTFIGYEAQEIVLGTQTMLAVVLKERISQLDDVLVVGYGSVAKKDLTGSVGQADMADMAIAPVSSFEEALAGRIAGVTVSAIDGQPGQEMNITIRGGNSLTQSNAPLYVIDGFPIEDSDNAAINPDDIESLNVLKDASATAIYGSRGANGVIIIETKKGKIGTPVITFNNSFGFQEVQKTMDVMSPYDFVKYQLERSNYAPAAYTPGDLDPSHSSYDPEGRTLEDYKHIKGISWQDEAFRRSLNRIHNIALRGGSEQTKYAISGSVYSQDGILLNSGYDRYQGRVNLTQTISKKLEAGINTNISKRITTGTRVAEGEGSSFTSYLLSRLWGYRPVTGNIDRDLLEEDIDEDVINQYDARFNPIVTSNNAHQKAFYTDIIGNIYAKYQLHKNLSLKISGSLSNRARRSERYYNSKTPRGSSISYFNNKGVNSSIAFYERTTLSNENTLTYKKIFNKDHRVTVMGGLSFQESKYNNYGFSNQQIPNENLGMSGIDQGSPYASDAYMSEYSLFSSYTRLNYNYKSTYLFTGTMRADGSSKFIKENRWGYFPSVAFAWNMHKEPWFKRLDFVSESKLRISYGLTGNNRVGEYDRFPSLDQPFPSSYSWENATPVLGAVISDLGNPDLKWETTEQIDIGWDLGLLENKITLTVDLYRKNTRDLLLRAKIPPTTGFSYAMKNIGSVRNEGLELSVNTDNIKSETFSWSSNFNISFNRNKILALAEEQSKLFSTPSFESQYNANPLYIAEIGRPAAMFFGYIWDGVYTYDDFDNPSTDVYVLKSSVSANGTDRVNIRPGDIKYRDLNKDGTVNSDDLTILGRALPLHSGGFNNNFAYNNFSLNVFFQWSYGNKIYNANRLMFEGNSNSRNNLNQYAVYANRWSPENPNSTIFRTGGQGVVGYHSSRVLEDGSYLRLKTVSLGYDIPERLIRGAFLNQLNLSLAAQNLITWTNYSGMDPEVSVRNSILTPGFDFSAYPIPRTLVFSIKATF